MAHRLIRKEIRDNKYSSVTSEGVLVGYTEDNFNYQIFDLSSKKIIISHDVIFFEDIFPFLKDSPKPEDMAQFIDEELNREKVTIVSETTKGQLEFNTDPDNDEEETETPPEVTPGHHHQSDQTENVSTPVHEEDNCPSQLTQELPIPYRRSNREKQ